MKKMNNKELYRLLEMVQRFGNTYEIETQDLEADIEDIINKDNDEDEHDAELL